MTCFMFCSLFAYFAGLSDVSALKYAKQEVVLTDGGENAYQRSRLTGNGSAGFNDIKALGASSHHEATLPIHQVSLSNPGSVPGYDPRRA